MQVRVNLQDVSAGDALKLKKIFHLSASRKRQYIFTKGDADLLITANSNYQVKAGVPVVTLGADTPFVNSVALLKRPIISIRVLKILDSVELSLPPAAVIEEIVTPAVTPKVESLNAYSILIVDDSLLIHKALQLEIEKAAFGADLGYAESGEECLAMLKEKKYDLVFLDVMMPGIDGYETCTEIRKMPVFKKTPVIMLSSKTSPLDEVKGVIAGCTTYLPKPIKHDEFQKLLKRMDKWLENFNS